MINTGVGVVALVLNQLVSWLTLNFRVRYHAGECTCQASGGAGVVTHKIIVVEGGTPLAVLSAVRRAASRLLRRLFGSIRVSGLGGMSVGNVIFVRPGRLGDARLMAHECGHTEQSRLYGPLYIPLVGLFTLFGGWPIRYFEDQATRLGRSFRKRERRNRDQVQRDNHKDG